MLIWRELSEGQTFGSVEAGTRCGRGDTDQFFDVADAPARCVHDSRRGRGRYLIQTISDIVIGSERIGL